MRLLRGLRGLRGLRVLHPFPSVLNAGLVFGLALLAGGSAQVAAALALAMLGLQFCIGAINDVTDEAIDRRVKPGKPIPAGLVSRRTAILLGVGSGGGGLLLALALDLSVLLLAAGGLAAGLAYDLFLKRGPWGWVAFAVGLPLLPLYAWYGAAGTLPPRAEVLLPLAALAGPALQLANGLVDLERDRIAGLSTLPARLGRRGSIGVMATILVVIHALAWTIVTEQGVALAPAALVAVAGGASIAALALSTNVDTARRELGWRAQAVAMALLALGWAAAVGPA